MKKYLFEYKLITAMEIEVEAEDLKTAEQLAKDDEAWGIDKYCYTADWQIVDVKEDEDAEV